jgi:1-aminocyclopropane-1-carboxylate deaminase
MNNSGIPFFENDVPIQSLEHPVCSEKGVIVDIKRLDLLHPFVNGNKGFKLKYNLLKAMSEEGQAVLTFGGAWSNHIYATAAAGKELGIRTIGIIRGEELARGEGQRAKGEGGTAQYSSTLEFARACGMHLEFVSRLDYEEKNTDEFKAWLQGKFGDFHLVPEGGSNYYGINGCMEILSASDKANYDVVALAVGTGATLAGMLLSATPRQRFIGFSALKGGDFLRDDVLRHLEYFLMNKELANDFAPQFSIETAYHFGGYGKWNEELLAFMQAIEQQHHLPLDQVYTGKALFGLLDLIAHDTFTSGERILFVHTGGLQGRGSI